jgi:hypothetical protein
VQCSTNHTHTLLRLCCGSSLRSKTQVISTLPPLLVHVGPHAQSCNTGRGQQFPVTSPLLSSAGAVDAYKPFSSHRTQPTKNHYKPAVFQEPEACIARPKHALPCASIVTLRIPCREHCHCGRHAAVYSGHMLASGYTHIPSLASGYIQKMAWCGTRTADGTIDMKRKRR